MSTRNTGHFLKEWRQHMRMTQKEFAEYVGLSMSNYNYLEAGKTGYTQKSLEMIAKALEVSPADLLSKNPMEEMPSPMERDLWDDLYDVFLELNPDNQQMTYKIASMFKSHQQKRIMARLRFAKEEQGPTD